jgi:adenosylmethionine-8-amino-7-oxononanoate aminotransferase
MTTNPAAIKHLWTHKTQDHGWLPDEDLVVDRAEGVWVWTENGTKLLDGFAGLAVVNAGHGRREIAEAIAEQTVRLAYYPTTRQFSNRPAAELAAKLATLTPGDLDYTMFAVSGSEANERAMQMARHYWLARGKTDKHKVISLEGGYHGATMGTFAICGLPHMTGAYAPLQPAGFAKVKPPYPFRDRGTGTEAELVERRARELRETIEKEGPDTVSAVIMEPVISSGGFVMPPIGWLKAVRKICDDLEVLMIADEVITGFGRTGRWFAVEHDGVVPDIMSVAKGITSGYIPLGGLIVGPRIAEPFWNGEAGMFRHGYTYSGHATATAAAHPNLDIMEREQLPARALELERALTEALAPLVDHPLVTEVRSGVGVIAGVQPDPELVAADPTLPDRLRLASRASGVLTRTLVGGALQVSPALTVTRAQLDEIAAGLAAAFDQVAASVPAGAASA